MSYNTTNEWRFRNLFGKLVLQRLVERDGPSEVWRDAVVEDISSMQAQELVERDRLQRNRDSTKTPCPHCFRRDCKYGELK